jgi:hypothetical protein
MTLNQGRPQDRCLDKLRFAHALAAGTVKQNRVTVGFPDRGQLHAAWSVQAKEHAARPPAANQDSLSDVKGANLQFILLAYGVLDVSAKLVQVVNLKGLRRH